MIIGITGTLGAGKGTIVDYLIQTRQFKHYSARAYLTTEIEKRGLPVNRDSMVLVANDLRAKNSPSFVLEELYRLASADGGDAVLESVRTPGEVEFLRKQKDFFLLAVDADQKVRYERILKRSSETDHISFEEFCANEAREMSSEDPNKQNLAKCIVLADFKVDNNGSFEDCYAQVESFLKG